MIVLVSSLNSFINFYKTPVNVTCSATYSIYNGQKNILVILQHNKLAPKLIRCSKSQIQPKKRDILKVILINYNLITI